MIWVIGSRGMLGRELVSLLQARGIPFCASDVEVSITSPGELAGFTGLHRPDWVVNCAAYTAVDRAEDEPEVAYRINAEGVENIARLCAEHSIRLVHISTDYVFNGTSSVPLTEDAPTGPIGVYGASKLEGEKRLQGLHPEHFILRTAWLYGKYGRNFVYTMLKLLNCRDELRVVDDQVGSPTWTRQLADAILSIIDHNSSQFGTYHFSGDGRTSWFGFAQKIYELGHSRGLIQNECVVRPVTSDQYPTRAKRPAYSLLDKSRVRETFGIEIEPWESALESFLKGVTTDDIK